MLTSKITSKGQITIPKKVRETLDAKPGDTLAYDLQPDGSVKVRKLQYFDAAWHAALALSLEEWVSPEDDEAFRGL